MFSFLLKRVKGSRDHDHHERILIDSNCLSSADNCSSILFRMTSMQQVEITMTTVCLPTPVSLPRFLFLRVRVGELKDLSVHT